MKKEHFLINKFIQGMMLKEGLTLPSATYTSAALY